MNDALLNGGDVLLKTNIVKVGRLLRLMRIHATPGNKPWPIQAWEIAVMQLTGRLGPFQYYCYELYRKGAGTPDELQLMGLRTYGRMQARLNSREWLDLLMNKWFFHMHYASFQFPLPHLYGIFNERNGVPVDGGEFCHAQDLTDLVVRYRLSGIVVKPIMGARGRNVLVLDCSPDGRSFMSLRGRSFTVEGLVEHMSGETFLVEERLEQHAFLREINPYNNNTVRAVTFRDVSGAVHIHYTLLRLGRKGRETDNVNNGGLAVQVDPVSGLLGWGYDLNPERPQAMDSHPDTGTAFRGKVIPMWQELTGLCLNAAKLCPLGSVGWDVLITETGPMLIEGNAIWDSRQLGQRLGGYLTDVVRVQLGEYGIV